MTAVVKKTKHNYIAEVVNSKKLKVFENDYNMYAYMGALQYYLDNGFVSFFKLATENRWSLSASEWDKLIKFIDEEDFYCSINNFYAPGKQSSKYVKGLNALVVDLDYYNIDHLKGLTAEQVIGLLEMDLKFPTPTYYVDSGRGLYIIWLLEKTHATDKSKKYWRSIEKTLIEYFEPFGADKKVKDPARVFRMIGTINSKTGRRVRLISPVNQTLQEYCLNPIRYEMSDIAEYFWGIQEEKKTPVKTPKKAVKKESKVVSLKNILTLHYKRCKDLERLVELRVNKPLEGMREQLLFIYRLQLLMANIEPENALKMVLKLNRKLLDPLDENEVINATKSAEDNAEIYFRLKKKYNDEMRLSLNQYLSNNGVYLYKNSTIIKEFEITSDEMEQMEILIDSNEKNRRKRIKYHENKKDISIKNKQKYQDKLKTEGKMSKNEQLNILYDKIKSLRLKGLKNKDIKQELGLATSTLERHITNMKKNGLL